jgi:TPP-dependent pyruvate/acetoin dehydrogenase alpha subunit
MPLIIVASPSLSFLLQTQAVRKNPMTSLSNDELLQLYYYMVLTRRFEETMSKLFHGQKIAENLHRSLGQEAVGVGATFKLRKDDILVPSLRTRGAFFVKGVDLNTMMAAVYGRKTAPNVGKESSHHMGVPELGIILTTGLVGSQIPLATGASLAIKLKGTDQVAVCFFGDGATSRGDFHEGLNLAAVQQLPVVFVCENNQYAWSTPLSRQMKVEDIVSKAPGYGIQGAKVDGQNVLEVCPHVQEAVGRARKGLGPTLVECKTYRFAGHSDLRPDWDAGRPKEELAHWRARDPIRIFEGHLKERGAVNDTLKEENEARIERELKEAIAYAERSPKTTAEDLLTDVYASFT